MVHYTAAVHNDIISGYLQLEEADFMLCQLKADSAFLICYSEVPVSYVPSQLCLFFVVIG